MRQQQLLKFQRQCQRQQHLRRSISIQLSISFGISFGISFSTSFSGELAPLGQFSAYSFSDGERFAPAS
jgi:hypothetical protein